jgi:predicted dehydrogenase
MCEKPLAVDSRESAELVQRAASSGLKTAVNYNVRYYPVCIEAAQRIASGELGDIFHITGSYVQDWLHQPTDFNWRVSSVEGGALRAMADIGTHWLDLVQTVGGCHVKSVCADLQTVHPIRKRPEGGVETFSGKVKSEVRPLIDVPIDTEDYGSVLLHFDNGARGTMHVSQVTAGHKNSIRFEIAGSKKSMAWNSQYPDELWIGNRNSPNEIVLRDPGMMSSTAAKHAQYPGGHNEGFPDTFKQLYRSFYAAIDGDADYRHYHPFPTFEDGHREILLCEAILKSGRTRAWVDV